MMNNENNSIIEKVWQDLDGQMPREQISRVVDEIALEYQDATVKAFVSIFVHRQALERLKHQLNEPSLPANGRFSFADGQGPDYELATKSQFK